MPITEGCAKVCACMCAHLCLKLWYKELEIEREFPNKCDDCQSLLFHTRCSAGRSHARTHSFLNPKSSTTFVFLPVVHGDL